MDDTNNKLTIPHPADQKEAQAARAGERLMGDELSPWQLAKMLMAKVGILNQEGVAHLSFINFALHVLAWAMLLAMFIRKWDWPGFFVVVAFMAVMIDFRNRK